MECYRQGDVLLIRVEAAPAGETRPVPREGERIVLAHGELTGHAHAIADADAELRADAARRRWLRVGAAGATLRHEEHAPIALPPGTYRVVQQREYAPDSAWVARSRLVRD